MVALASGKAEGIEGGDATERSVCENGLGILEAEDDEDEDFASGGGRAKPTAVGDEDEGVDAMAR